MSHDLRNEIGYKHIPASDPEEQRLRDALFRARGVAISDPSPRHEADVILADKELSTYLWERACRIVAEDRAKHPKKKRNLPVPKGIEVGEGRVLP